MGKSCQGEQQNQETRRSYSLSSTLTPREALYEVDAKHLVYNIPHEFPILEQNLPMPSSIHFNGILDLNLVSSITYFKHTTVDEVNVLLYRMNKTTCMFDPFPTRVLFNFSKLFIDVIVRIINLTFSTASFPAAFKSAVVKPLFKILHLTAIFKKAFVLFPTYHTCLS